MKMDADQLPSWNETPTRDRIIDFVEAVATPGSEAFLEAEARIACFDNDGTLWPEKPMPIQLDFMLRRLGVQAEADPALRDRQPWKACFEHDTDWLGQAMVKHYQGDDGDMALLAAAVPSAFAGLTVEEYADTVTEFFRTASHPSLDRPYRTCGYRPMVELIRYLEANSFVVYIASGGDRDFMRPIAEHLYGIPPERVIGSSLALDYHDDGDERDVLYKAEMEFFDDGPTKPVRIWSRIGRRPIMAAGNANGDVPMLRFARANPYPSLRLVLRHDDANREFDYTAGTEEVLARARAADWTVISIRNDWSTVFAG